MAIAAGATFVAQGVSTDIAGLIALIEQGARHPGFAFVNVFSPCVTFNKVNTYDWYREHLTRLDSLPGYDPRDKAAALATVEQYEGLVTGLVYQNTDRPPYDKLIRQESPGPLTDKAVPLDKDILERLLEDFR